MGDRERITKNPIKVGFYDIEKTIGKGNFAVVKLAKHRITRTEVSFDYIFFYFVTFLPVNRNFIIFIQMPILIILLPTHKAIKI